MYIWAIKNSVCTTIDIRYDTEVASHYNYNVAAAVVLNDSYTKQVHYNLRTFSAKIVNFLFESGFDT